MTGASEEILTRIDANGVARLTLNRPKAINSLNQNMIDLMAPALTTWADDDAVCAVIIDGAGERGLCAGGDVVALYHSAKADGSAARKFWFDEYRLNAFIGDYPKPYVALMDGIVMGGGVGISAHGNVRVATDTTKMAMPEVGIGFIPDVGGTYLLARAGALGLHAALTGSPFGGADAIALGFADHYVPQQQLPAFTAAIIEHDVDTAVNRYAIEPPASDLVTQRHWIDECFQADGSIGDILSRLRGHDNELAQQAADVISGRSPIALAVTLESIRRATKLESLRECLVQEYRVSCASARSHDFVEGIRAQLVDKDRNPTWSPASSAAVTDGDIENYFLPVDPELTF